MLLTELYPRPLNIIEGPLMKVILLILQLLIDTWVRGNKIFISLSFSQMYRKSIPVSLSLLLFAFPTSGLTIPFKS